MNEINETKVGMLKRKIMLLENDLCKSKSRKEDIEMHIMALEKNLDEARKKLDALHGDTDVV